MVYFEHVIGQVRSWCEARGIRVHEQELPRGKAGEFTGTSVVMNCEYAPEERVYYLVHALGSVVLWSLDHKTVQALFDELRDAKESRNSDPRRLKAAIDRYRAFEITSSEYAVWLLKDCDYSEVAPTYTNFMRADLEAMTEFHWTGEAPVWRSFFQKWNEQVATGERQVEPFHPLAIPDFQPVDIEKQEILQRQDRS